MAALPNANSLRILSIDGGGMKGYTALLILKRILRAIRVQAKKEGIDLADDPRPCDVFDLIVGTSTGGLIAIMLGRLHMTVDECIEQYEVLGKKVFGKTQWADQTGRFAKGMLNLPFYDIDTLQAAIISVLKLRKIQVQEDFKEDAPVCRTMVCVTRKGTTTAGVLRNYESEHSTQVDYKCTIWEAASATAAAPMFFKAVKFKSGGEIWCDGGIHRNNPINVALAELQFETSWKQEPIGCVLSIGTGAPRIKNVSNNLAKFLKHSIEIMTDAEKIAEDFAMSRDGRELAETQRYFRFSVVQGMEDLEMDEYKETEQMKALTDNYLGKTGSGNEVDRCAKSLLLPDQNCQQRASEKPELLLYQNCVHFVNRERYSAELHRFFNPTVQGQRRFVLWGMGGVGKTQIALSFAQSIRNRLSVYWIRADSLANFLNDFSQIMTDRLDPSETNKHVGSDRHSSARSVTARLEKDASSWLLILDNADKYNLFVETAEGQNLISSYVPKAGRVLITTRDPRLQGTIAAAKDGLKVTPMDKKEARELFTKSIPDELVKQSSLAIVDELLDLLGSLPLALAQAAANIADQQRPVHDYITAYREKRNRMALMERPVFDSQTQDSRTSHQSILVTYEMSFEDLERAHQLSARCLNYFGFFHWHNIPEFCIRALPGLKELDDQSFHNVLKRLLHLSMIEPNWKPDGNEYSVHPVIHERIFERLSLEARRSYLSDSVTVMKSMFPFHRRDNEREYYSLCQHLQSHVLLQINLALDTGLKTRKLALLNMYCASFLRRSGMISDSVRLATQAIAIGQEIWGPHSESTIRAYNERALCLYAGAQYREAYDEFKASLERLESAKLLNEAMGSQEYMIIRGEILDTMSRSCRWLGKLEEAEEIGRELIRLWDDLGTDAPDDSRGRLFDQTSLIGTLEQQGKLQEARKLNDELLDSMDEHQQMVHREQFLSIYAHKALILKKMRQGSDAEPAVVLTENEEIAILQIFRDVFNEARATHPMTDISLWINCNNLLRELFNKGEMRKAAEILTSMLTEAVESESRFEGTIIVVFAYTSKIGLELVELLHKTRDARQGPPGSPIASLLIQLTALLGHKPGNLWRGAYSLYVFARLFSTVGDPRRAKDLLQEALQDHNLLENRSNEGSIHYGLMLAIAQQGRIDDARRYRNTHIALIGPVESKSGDLDEWLQCLVEEKDLYYKAKAIVFGQDRKVEKKWWTENRVVLNRAQLKYGPLIRAKAEEISCSFMDDSDSKGKMPKRKSRGVRGLTDKVHWKSGSNSRS